MTATVVQRFTEGEILRCPTVTKVRKTSYHRSDISRDGMTTLEHGETYRWRCKACGKRSLVTYIDADMAARWLARHLDDGYCPAVSSKP
jgi:hypothetical protein